jgi:protein N-terminal amidase
MRVAAVQFKATYADPAASRARVESRMVEARTAGVDLIVLPEMAFTGYVFAGPSALEAVAEPADGPTYAWASEQARRARCWVVVGFPERAADRLFNSALVVDPAGGLAFCYRKTLLFDADRTWATPGDSGYRRFETDAGSFAVGICMDLNDPRFLLWAWRQRLDVLAFPTNWIEEGLDVHAYWRERTEGSGAGLAAANTWGPERGVEFSGRSALMAGGEVVAAARRRGDACLVANVTRRPDRIDADLR